MDNDPELRFDEDTANGDYAEEWQHWWKSCEKKKEIIITGPDMEWLEVARALRKYLEEKRR